MEPIPTPIPGSEIDLSKLDQNVAEKVKRSLAADMPVFQGPRPGQIIGPSEDRLPPMPKAPQMPSIPKITTPVIPPMPPIQITPQPIPRVEVPVNLPKINIPNIPKPNIPSIPKFDAPIGAPSIFGFGPTP